MRSLWSCNSTCAWVIVLSAVWIGSVEAQTCTSPTRPYVPSDAAAVLEFREVIRQDFETYLQNVQRYGNWCLERDGQLMPLLTTAHIACGFHASDPVTLRETVALAVENDLVIGAHPGLPDKLGFGRRVMAISEEDAYAYTAYQIGALQAFLNPHSIKIKHVIPHGALYHLVGTNLNIAGAVARAAEDVVETPGLYYPAPKSAYLLAEICESKGFSTIPAYYPDLEYKESGELVLSRKMNGTDTTRVFDQVCRLLNYGFIKTYDDKRLELTVSGIGFHGDGPNAIEVAVAIREAIVASGCEVSPWTSPQK